MIGWSGRLIDFRTTDHFVTWPAYLVKFYATINKTKSPEDDCEQTRSMVMKTAMVLKMMVKRTEIQASEILNTHVRATTRSIRLPIRNR